WIGRRGSLVERPVEGFAAAAGVVVRDRARGNSQKPCDEWNALPFELRYAREGFAKDFGRQILRRGAITHAARDIRVDAVEVVLIQSGEPGGIAPGAFDSRLFLVKVGHEPLRRFCCSNPPAGGKSYGGFFTSGKSSARRSGLRPPWFAPRSGHGSDRARGNGWDPQ